MLVAVIADTHLPRGRRALPAACIQRLRQADLIVHAGDLTALAVLDELRGYGEVVAVQGNADDAQTRARLPVQLELALDGARLAVVHDGGRRTGRLQRLRRRFPGVDAVVFGHSHTPLHETSEDGFQIFNPGSPTDKRRAATHTMGLATTTPAGLRFELLALD